MSVRLRNEAGATRHKWRARKIKKTKFRQFDWGFIAVRTFTPFVAGHATSGVRTVYLFSVNMTGVALANL